MRITKLVVVLFVALSLNAVVRADDISSRLANTTDPSAWLVSVDNSGVDVSSYADPLDTSLFLLGSGDFVNAVTYTGRADYIANHSDGNNGGRFTQFVFRQTFDLTGFDPTTAVLNFKWAADDIGNSTGAASRGHWQPQFTLNGGSFQDAGNVWYDYTDNTVHLSDGFLPGLNTLDFYVQGNGTTDGMELKTVSFTADPGTAGVPDAASSAMLTLIGLIAVATIRRALRR